MKNTSGKYIHTSIYLNCFFSFGKINNNNMSKKLVFVLDDKLPMSYHTAVSNFKDASKPKSKKMISSVHAYACSLIDIWQRSFGNDHVMTRIAVTYKINKIVDHYYNHVYANSHQNASKNKNQEDKRAQKSSRMLNKHWRSIYL